MNKLVTVILLLVPSLLAAATIPVVCHNELTSWISAGQKVAIVDIQSAEGFRAHNYEHSIATGNDSRHLKKAAAKLRTGTGKVIVVSASGGAEATRAAERLVRGGVQRSRILLLDGGMEAAASKAACDCCKPASVAGADR